MSGRWWARLRGDRGSATVWGVGGIAVLCVVFGVVLGLGSAVLIRHRAAGGADMAALAAADHWMEGTAAACARAERVARAQGTRLVRCVIAGEIADVTAAAGRGPFTAEVRARAGSPGAAESAAVESRPVAPGVAGPHAAEPGGVEPGEGGASTPSAGPGDADGAFASRPAALR